MDRPPSRVADDLDRQVRDWFKALYEVLFGQSAGPRFGSFAAIFGILLQLTLGLWLTRHLRELIAAGEAMAAGDLSTRVPVRSHDEVGQLAGLERAQIL